MAAAEAEQREQAETRRAEVIMRAFLVFVFLFAGTAWADSGSFPADAMAHRPLLSNAGVEKHTLLAQKGELASQIKLCEHYPSDSGYGEGLWTYPQDFLEGKKWCLKAAETGDAKSQAKLAIMFISDVDNANYSEAYFWSSLAQKSGERSWVVAKAKEKLSPHEIDAIDRRVLAWPTSNKH